MVSTIPDSSLAPSRDDRKPLSGTQDHRQLTRRLLASAMVVVATIVGLTAALLWHLHQQQLADGLADLKTVDLLAAAQTERTFATASLVLDGISDDLQAAGIASAADLRRLAGDESSYRLLRAKMAAAPQLAALSVVDAAGDLVNYTRSFPVEAPANDAARDYFLRLRDHPELNLYVSAPARSSADGAATIYVAKRLNAPNGGFAGIVVGALRLSYFESLYAKQLSAIAGDGASIALWRNDGTLLARAPQQPPDSPAALADPNRPMPTGGLDVFWDDRIQPGVAVARRQLDDFPLTIELRQPAGAILDRWSAGIVATLGGSATLLALVGLVVWLLMRQSGIATLAREQQARADREAQARAEIERAMTTAEAAMRDAQHSEARFRDIVEIGSDWIWETDAEHRFTLIAGARRPKVDLIGRTRWEQAGADPETDEVWRQHKAQLDAHQPFRQFRFSINLPNGRFDVCVGGKPIFDDDGSFVGYRGTVTDESELVAAREQAARADALLRNAIDSIAEGFVIYDADDRFVLANEAYRKMYPENADGFVPGTRFEDIMRRALATGRHPDAIGREEEWLAERVRKHRNAAEPEESRLADGRWVMRSERRMADGGIAGLRIDITALKRAQETLRERQVMLDRAQRVAAIGCVLRRLKTNTVEWSDEMYRLFGLDRESYDPGDTEAFLERIHPDDRARVRTAIEDNRRGRNAEPMQFRILRQDGTERWVYREVEIFRDGDGTTSEFLTTYKDVTERVAGEARQRELEAMLRDAIESIQAGFVIYDADDRLVICNEAYRNFYPQSHDTLVPGARFEDILRAAMRDGLYPDAQGREEEWLAERIRHHHATGGTIETRLSDGRWILVSERPMSNGWLAGLRVDITEIKNIQQSLRESQAMLNRAQRLSSTASAVRNLETDGVEWSDEMYRMFGLARGAVTPGREHFRAYIHPEDQDRVPSARDIALDGRDVPPVQFRIVRPDGTVRWVYREVELIRDAGDKVTSVLTTYKDITERRELEALLRDAIESIQAGFVVYDADDRLVICNDAYRLLNPEITHLIEPGVHFADILRARGRDEEWIANWLRQRRTMTGPVEMQTQDGRWVLVYERPMSNGGLAGLRIDITELKNIQQSLRESQQRLDRTQQIAHIGTVERNLRTNEVIWSDETYRIFGVDRDAYAPGVENLIALVHPQDRGSLITTLQRENFDHANSNLKFRIVQPSGDIRVVLARADITCDEAGEPHYISVAMMDITDKELASHRQAELETQLRHSEKLTALGTLAGGIAHDLNNTLVPIQALSKLAMQALPADADARGDLETIYQASLQARDLVRRILLFSRKQETVQEPTDVAAKVREALHMLRASVPATIELIEQIEPVPPLLTDASQIQQIVVNLVTNGAHAIGDKLGRVTVSLDETANDASETGRVIRLRVADTGCGMSAEVMHRIFEPFFTTKGVGEGTGLGLSVVHGIVTGQGGSINIRSAPGEGSEFVILLPARAVPAEIAAVA